MYFYVECLLTQEPVVWGTWVNHECWERYKWCDTFVLQITKWMWCVSSEKTQRTILNLNATYVNLNLYDIKISLYLMLLLKKLIYSSSVLLFKISLHQLNHESYKCITGHLKSCSPHYSWLFRYPITFQKLIRLQHLIKDVKENKYFSSSKLL